VIKIRQLTHFAFYLALHRFLNFYNGVMLKHHISWYSFRICHNKVHWPNRKKMER